MKEKEVEMEEKKNSHSSFIWSAVPSVPLEFSKVIHCSDGAAAPMGSMTYDTRILSLKLRGQPEGLRGQSEGLNGQSEGQEASWRL